VIEPKITRECSSLPALERDDWVELGVPIGHRARIVKEHKALHPEMW